VDTAVINKITKSVEKAASKAATSTAKETGSEFGEEFLTSVVTDYALTGKVDLNKALTQGVVGGFVAGKTTASIDSATSINNTVSDVQQTFTQELNNSGITSTNNSGQLNSFVDTSTGQSVFDTDVDVIDDLTTAGLTDTTTPTTVGDLSATQDTGVTTGDVGAATDVTTGATTEAATGATSGATGANVSTGVTGGANTGFAGATGANTQANTGVVIATDTSAGTALIMDGSGKAQVVSITGTATPGSEVTLTTNSTGAVSITTQLTVDNINILTNTISSTDTNGTITLDPNGSGNVVLTFANGGNLTNDRNYVHGACDNVKVVPNAVLLTQFSAA